MNTVMKMPKSYLTPADKKLKGLFSEIHDYLYVNSNIKIAGKIGNEMVKLLLCKYFDERFGDEYCKFYYYDENLQDVYELWESTKNVLPEFQGETLDLDLRSIIYVVERLQSLSLMGTDSDVIGESFQIFIEQSHLQNRGAFFTEHQVVKLAVEMLGVNPNKDECFIDPFQGTGGFTQEFASKICREADDRIAATKYCSEHIFGIDIESELVKLAKAKMVIVYGVDNKMFRENSFEHPENWGFDTKKNVVLGTFDKIGSNPPFGANLKVTDESILRQYELAKKWQLTNNGEWMISSPNAKPIPRVPDILGLERIVQLLARPEIDRNGNQTRAAGMGAVVLPRQILSGPKETYVREWLLRNTIVRAVVDLPSETFQPHTGTKTSVVLFEKRACKNPEWYKENNDIFMAVVNKIGHDRRGLPEYRKNIDGFFIIDDKSGEYVINTDIPEIISAWRAYSNGIDPKSEYSSAFSISTSDISIEDLRLDASFYKNDSSEKDNNKISLQIPSGWFVNKLGDYVLSIQCPGRCKRMYVQNKENGIPFLSGSCISHYMPNNAKLISKKMPNINEFVLKKDWILITRSGTTGIVSIVPEAWEGLAASDHIFRIIIDTNKMRPEYLYLFLRSEYGQSLLQKGIYGSVVDEITSDFLANIPVPYSNNDQEIDRVCSLMRKSLELKNQSLSLFKTAEDEFNKLFG